MRLRSLVHIALFFVIGSCMGGPHTWAESQAAAPCVIDFGVVRTGEEARHAFPIRNEGRGPLEIKGASSSSDSLHILSYPQVIRPGGTGKLEVRWIPSAPGTAAHEVLVETSASSSSVLRFILEGRAEGELSERMHRLTMLGIPGEWFTRVIKKPDTSLLVSAELVRKELLRSGGAYIVDIRRRADFDKYRIPGSMNIPLFAVKTKEFLKSPPVILVGEGYEHGPMERACARLRELGFTVSVLEGGMDGWVRRGLPVEGSAASARPYKAITPRELFEERHSAAWLLLNACGPGKTDGLYFIPQARVLPIPEKSRDMASIVEGIVYEDREYGGAPVLIFDDDGSGVPMIAEALHKSRLESVFFLEGGLDAYRAFLTQQAALAKSRSNSSKGDLKKCSICP